MGGLKNYGTFTRWTTTQQKGGAPTFCNSMDGNGDTMLSEISQLVKDKYHMISPIRGI